MSKGRPASAREQERASPAPAWNCENAFQLCVCLLFLGGFLTWAVAEGSGLQMVLPVVAAVLWAWRRPPRELSNRAQYGWFALLGLFALLDFLIFRSLVDTTIHLLLATGLLKLFSRSQDKDYLFLFFISFSFLLVASANTISAVFLASLLAFVFAAILCLILYESRRSYRQSSGAAFSFRAHLQLAAAVTLLIALIAVPIFILIPRTSMGFFHSGRAGVQLSGFSNEVQLGEIGRIINNSSLVMRVHLDRPAEEISTDLKWRGIALDHYDGKTWRNTQRQQGRLRWSPQYQGYLAPFAFRTPEPLLIQQISLEVDSPVVFGAAQVVMLRSQLRRYRFTFDGNYNLYQLRPRSTVYTVYSDFVPRPRKLAEVREGPFPAEIRAVYLQLPRSINPEIGSLAVQAAGGQSSALGKAVSIEQYLQDNYAYSLDNRSASSPDPLYDFLFVTRSGHCEYFATAQAVMMRVLGIPSRVVNGFRRGEYNPWSGSFTVRQSDAHSWAEGFFPGAGWVEFDPTPAASGEPSIYALRVAGQLLDALDQFWGQIVTFDQVKQWGLFRSVFLEVRQLWERLGSIPEQMAANSRLGWWNGLRLADVVRSPLFYGLLILAAGLWLLYRYRRYLKLMIKRLLRKKAAEIAPEYYLEMLDILERRGLSRHPAETPAEFARRAGQEVRSPLPGRITELYYRNRFGHHPLNPEHLGEIYGGLKALRSLRIRRT